METSGAEREEVEIAAERVAFYSVLQELTVAVLALFEPSASPDEFAERVADRFACSAVLCFEVDIARGLLRLEASAGLSTASRTRALPRIVGEPDWQALELPFPEVSRRALVRWVFIESIRPDERRRRWCLMLFFEPGHEPPREFQKVLAHVARLMQAAFEHRATFKAVVSAERALAESEQRYRSLFEHNPDLVFAVDAEGRITAMNPAAERASGYRVDELLGKPYTTLLFEEDHPQARKIFEMTKKGHGRSLEFAMRSKKGERVVLSFTSVPIVVEGQVVGVFGIAQDVTQQRLAQAAENERRERISRQQSALLRMATAPRNGASLDVVLRRITEIAAETLDVDLASVWLIDERDGVLRCKEYYERPTRKHIPGPSLDVQQASNYFAALATGRALAVPDATSDPRTAGFVDSYLRPRGIVSLLDAPVRIGGKIVGVVCHEQQRRRREWTADEIAFASDVGDQVAHALLEAERSRAEAELRESEAEYRALFEHAGDAILVLSTNGIVTAANEKAIELTGYPREEIIGLLASRLGMEKLEAWVAEALTAPKLDATRAFETSLRRRDGSRADVDISLRVVELKGTPLVQLFIRDVTERTRAEAERARLLEAERAARAEAEAAQRRLAFLADASARLSATLDYSSAASTLAHLVVPELADWCVVRLSDSDGAPPVAIVHRDPAGAERLRELLDHFPDVAARWLGLEQVTTSGTTWTAPSAREIDLAGVDPRARSLLESLGPCTRVSVPLVARGNRLGTMALGAKEGDRRFTAADILLIEDLARRAAIAIENARLYRDSQAAVRAREEFLSIASHELKTPLTSLLLTIQSTRRALQKPAHAGLTDQALDARLETMQRQAERLGKLVDNLLDVSRIGTGRLQLELEDVDLLSVVRESVSRLQAEPSFAGCTVDTHGHRSIVGRWDKLRLEQVLTNLLSNAVKYGRGRPIEVSVDATDTTAKLVVRDRGIGIAPADLARIFGRFERAAPARHYGGLGLGLYIVQQIIKLMGGTIQVESTLGEGTTFIVELPRFPETAAPKSANSPKSTESQQRP